MTQLLTTKCDGVVALLWLLLGFAIGMVAGYFRLLPGVAWVLYMIFGWWGPVLVLSISAIRRGRGANQVSGVVAFGVVAAIILFAMYHLATIRF